MEASIFSPFLVFKEMLESWFSLHSEFAVSTLIIVIINIVFGGYMHWKDKKVDAFSWTTLAIKTFRICAIMVIAYVPLELILSIIGKNLVTDNLRIALQIATLLFPGEKILKNVFILSKGQHPPKWIMDKIYDFKEHGDLQQFIDSKKEEDEDIDLEDIGEDIL